MIPDEVQAIVEALKRGTAGGAPASSRSVPKRRRAEAPDRALAELLMPALADPAAAPKIAELAKRAAAGHAVARKAAADAAAAGSKAAQAAVLAEAARRANAALDLAGATAAPEVTPRWFVIPQPFLIWPTGIVLDDSASVDLESYARFRVYTDNGGDSAGYVRFYYYWTNPYPDPVFASLASIGAWNGYCDVYLDGGLFSDDTGGLAVNATLEVLPVWEANAAFTTEASTNIFAASRQNTGFYSSYWEVNAATHSGAALSMTDLLIPANRTVIFTLTVTVNAYVYENGGASVDYSSGGYVFGSPAAVVTVTGRVVAP